LPICFVSRRLPFPLESRYGILWPALAVPPFFTILPLLPLGRLSRFPSFLFKTALVAKFVTCASSSLKLWLFLGCFLPAGPDTFNLSPPACSLREPSSFPTPPLSRLYQLETIPGHADVSHRRRFFFTLRLSRFRSVSIFPSLAVGIVIFVFLAIQRTNPFEKFFFITGFCPPPLCLVVSDRLFNSMLSVECVN